MTTHEEQIKQLLGQFEIKGHLKNIAPLKTGHINETFVSLWEFSGGKRARFIHQWINGHVFRDIPALMTNVARVTEHIRSRIPENTNECTLELVPTTIGTNYVQDSEGEYWRTYRFVEESESFAVCRDNEQARQASRIMGRFHRYLNDLDPTSVVDTIPFFHHVPRRYQTFERVVSADSMGRAETALSEIEFALQRRSLAGQIIEGIELKRLPLRVIHNDLKLNNILFNVRSREAMCLVDLDTVMGGSPLFDFGDLVRNVSIATDEDEADLSRIVIDLRRFEALVQGYAETVRESLVADEIELLAIAPRIMALALGLRFLTDYLEGDHYFRIHKPGHNLVRARAQFQVVRTMEQEEAAMRSIVERCFS